jgi:hypothetical protein
LKDISSRGQSATARDWMFCEAKHWLPSAILGAPESAIRRHAALDIQLTLVTGLVGTQRASPPLGAAEPVRISGAQRTQICSVCAAALTRNPMHGSASFLI